jgi:hypothetical protein
MREISDVITVNIQMDLHISLLMKVDKRNQVLKLEFGRSTIRLILAPSLLLAAFELMVYVNVCDSVKYSASRPRFGAIYRSTFHTRTKPLGIRMIVADSERGGNC